ncbi:MAG: single-stranded DNA-binding protein [Pseudomonadota bacterium]
MFQRFECIGNLGRDPEVRTFGDGGKVANLRVATSETWRDRHTGERKEKTEWIGVAVFGDGFVDWIARDFVKGDRVFVVGKLRTRKWQAQDGSDRYTTEVVVRGFGDTVRNLTPRDRSGGGGQGGGAGGDQGGGAGGDQGGGRTSGRDDLDDEIPF